MGYEKLQFALPVTAGLPMWWWFGWLLVGSVTVYGLFTWWYSHEAYREDELAAQEGADSEGHTGHQG